MKVILRAELAGVVVGDGYDVAVMAAINVSPESFYAGSVAAGREALLRAAAAAVKAGAALLDVGARSTAPYSEGAVSEDEEAARLGEAVHVLTRELGAPISADTCRLAPARAAVAAGARVLNDVGGLVAEPRLARLAAESGVGVIVMAGPRGPAGVRGGAVEPVEEVGRLLAESLGAAARAGIAAERIVVDPGIGFFRGMGRPWHEWDCAVLADLARLRALGRPIAVAVSRKSFIGAVAGVDDPAGRLPGSLAATAAAVLAGAALVRTHDVPETVQAVRVAESIRRARAEEAEQAAGIQTARRAS